MSSYPKIAIVLFIALLGLALFAGVSFSEPTKASEADRVAEAQKFFQKSLAEEPLAILADLETSFECDYERQACWCSGTEDCFDMARSGVCREGSDGQPDARCFDSPIIGKWCICRMA